MKYFKNKSRVFQMVIITALLGACVSSNVTGTYLVNVGPEDVMLQGYDVVAYFTKNKPIKGSQRFKTNYDHAVYHFASAESMALFASNPEKYKPQYGGFCAVAAAHNMLEEVEVDKFAILNDKLYLQRNAKAVAMWEEDPQGIVDQADKNWPGLVNKYGKPASSK